MIYKRAAVAFYVLILLLLLVPLAAGQESRATISGTVLDPSGAAIPNASITLTEVRTGVKTSAVSDSIGNYSIPFLPPGEYEIQADVSGFKTFLRKGLHLASSDHPILDLRMEIGQPTELVTVVAATPMLETANATTGQSISTAQVEDIPLNGRNPMMLAQLAIGVVATGNPNTPISPFANGAASGWSIGGTSSQTSEIMIDGAPNATWDNRVAYSPPQEAVQEVKVKAFDGDAGFGHTGGGTINKVMKTGTNKFRGSAYYYMQPSSLAANNFFNNRAGIPVQETKFNQWGGTAGGPVRIPKLYDGRNKLFWFFAFERISGSQPNTKFLTVPTEAERKGDFSSLLALGSTYQIYNPYSGVLSGTTVRRSPFYCDAAGNPITPNLTPGTAYGTQATGTPCNKLPQQLLNPVALAYLKFYPAPTCCLRIHSAYSARRLCSGKRMSSNSVSMRAATDSTLKPSVPRPVALLSAPAGHKQLRMPLQRHSVRISHPFFWACRLQVHSNRMPAAPTLRITMPCLFRMTGASSAT